MVWVAKGVGFRVVSGLLFLLRWTDQEPWQEPPPECTGSSQGIVVGGGGGGGPTTPTPTKLSF